MIESWYSLSHEVQSCEERQQTLEINGFVDVVEQINDLKVIVNCYSSTEIVKSNSNLKLIKMQIGGTAPLCVLKLEFEAVKPYLESRSKDQEKKAK